MLCLIHLLKKGEVYTVTPRNIRFHTGMLGEIVRYGLPSGIQNCVIGLANVIVQSQINSFGMLAMAAYGAALQDRRLRLSAHHELHDGLHHVRWSEPRRQAV